MKGHKLAPFFNIHALKQPAGEPAWPSSAQRGAYYSISLRINHQIIMHTAQKLWNILLILLPSRVKLNMLPKDTHRIIFACTVWKEMPQKILGNLLGGWPGVAYPALWQNTQPQKGPMNQKCKFFCTQNLCKTKRDGIYNTLLKIYKALPWIGTLQGQSGPTWAPWHT